MLMVPLHEAEGHLAELIARAEAGEEVVVTRDGRPVARVTVVADAADDAEALMQAIRRIQAEARERLIPGPDAARAADFLYDENGLPA